MQIARDLHVWQPQHIQQRSDNKKTGGVHLPDLDETKTNSTSSARNDCGMPFQAALAGTVMTAVLLDGLVAGRGVVTERMSNCQ
jgi:hypothetical protein